MNIKNNKNCQITINNEEIAVSEKEKTADEMFEELGYEKGEIGIFIQFNNIKELISITFNIEEKTVSKCKGYNEAIPITNKELQAINKKCKELGWLD